jgi:hypothetical protein
MDFVAVANDRHDFGHAPHAQKVFPMREFSRQIIGGRHWGHSQKTVPLDLPRGSGPVYTAVQAAAGDQQPCRLMLVAVSEAKALYSG